MAYNPNIPAPTNRVQDDIAAMRGNFQHLAPLAQLASVAGELQAVSELAPYIQALLSSRIVEMGSNSNGEYVRWENGLQVCWLFGITGSAPLDIQPGGNGTFRWVYPAQFAATPRVFGSVNQPTGTGGGRIVVIGSSSEISTVSADGYRYNTDSGSNTSGQLSLLAIGRWK